MRNSEHSAPPQEHIDFVVADHEAFIRDMREHMRKGVFDGDFADQALERHDAMLRLAGAAFESAVGEITDNYSGHELANQLYKLTELMNHVGAKALEALSQLSEFQTNKSTVRHTQNVSHEIADKTYLH